MRGFNPNSTEAAARLIASVLLPCPPFGFHILTNLIIFIIIILLHLIMYIFNNT